MDGETAKGCLQALARGKRIKIDEEACEAMVQRLGSCIPHHVQLFFWLAYCDCVHREANKISLADVETVYQKDMLGIRGHSELSHYEERLRMVLGKDMAVLAFNLLTVAAVKGQLTMQKAHHVSKENKSTRLAAGRSFNRGIGGYWRSMMDILKLQKDGAYTFCLALAAGLVESALWFNSLTEGSITMSTTLYKYNPAFLTD